MMKQLGNRRARRALVAVTVAGLLIGLAPLGPAGAQEARDTAQACAFAAESSFSDRPTEEAFSGPIDCIAWYGVTRGLPDGSYGVGALVTRGQMATFIINSVMVAGGDLPEDPPDAFDDDNGHAHEANIDNAAALEIARGVTADAFRPNNAVRRDQMATFVAQSIEALTGEALPTPEEDHFGDDDGTTHETRINQLAELGIVTGTGAGVYSPSANVTRRQMALFLARDLDHLTEDQAMPLRRLNPPTDVMDGPELVSVDIVTQSGGNVALRFVFDETVGTSIVPGNFHYYTSSAEQVTATSAARDTNNQAAVIASFPSEQFADATVAAVAFGAVESPAPESIANPEGSAAVQAVDISEGQTAAPDLVSVSVSGTTATFEFDEPATVAVDIPMSETSDAYHVVMPDGTVVNADGDPPGGNDTDTHTVTLESDGTGAVRGYIESGAVEDEDGNANPQQAAASNANGISATPDLVAVRPVPGDKVEYEFDSGVALPSSNPITGTPGGFRIYKLDGSEVTTDTRALKPGNNAVVVATFEAGDVDDTVVGGSVDGGSVNSAQNSTVSNRVDSKPVEAGFAPGDTAAPTLLTAGKILEGAASFPPGSTQNQVVFVFDQPVTLISFGPGETATQFVVYAADGGRVVLGGCAASGFKVTCTANSSSAAAAYEAITNGVRAGVEAGRLEDSSGTYANHEASAVMI
jgi:hypothetical protein